MTQTLARAAPDPERAVASSPGWRVLDSLLIADPAAWAVIPAAAFGEIGPRGDATMLWLAGGRSIEWTRDGRRATCPAGGGILLDLADGAEGMTGGADGLVLVLRQRVAATLAVGPAKAHVLVPSISLRALRSLAGAWLVSDVRLSDAQARLAGRAVGELVAAALLPLAAPTVGTRRKTSLLDRVITHIDGRFVEGVDAPALCRALHCSRSALYRSTRPVGGVVALLKQRRLAAVYDRLCDPAERASVGDLARMNGFDDQTQFSRSFKRRYGTTAGAVRATRRISARPC